MANEQTWPPYQVTTNKRFWTPSYNCREHRGKQTVKETKSNIFSWESQRFVVEISTQLCRLMLFLSQRKTVAFTCLLKPFSLVVFGCLSKAKKLDDMRDILLLNGLKTPGFKESLSYLLSLLHLPKWGVETPTPALLLPNEAKHPLGATKASCSSVSLA